MKFIFSCLDLGFFPENRGKKNEKMSILDDPFLFEYFRNLFERRSLF